MAWPLTLRRTAANGDFANRASGFVKRANALPAFPALELIMLAFTVVLTVAGAFHTDRIAPLPRALFWLVLMGWNTAKWQLWFAWTIRAGMGWNRSAVIGAIVLNALLPLEIPIALRLVGIRASVDPIDVWLEAGAIAGVLGLTFGTWRRRTARLRPAAKPTSFLQHLLVDPAQVDAVTAEDHYCRFHLAGGETRLILARFGDVIGALAEEDGEQTHRGAWVASRAVRGAERSGRSWRLILPHEVRMPVSSRFRAAVKTRGWLRPV